MTDQLCVLALSTVVVAAAASPLIWVGWRQTHYDHGRPVRLTSLTYKNRR